MNDLIAIQESSSDGVLQMGTWPVLIGGLALFVVLVLFVTIARRGRDRLDNQEGLYQQQFKKQNAEVENSDEVKDKKQDKLD